MIIDRCLNFAVERMIKELDISLRRKPQVEYSLSHTIFTAKYLTTLNLENVKIINIDGAISLPSLETVHLRVVRFGHREVFSHFLRECPSIKYLVLTSCSFALSHRTIKVSSCSLESF